MTGTQPVLIEIPEQLRIDIRTALGPIRQLARSSRALESSHVNFTNGKCSGRLYRSASGRQCLLVESKVTPPNSIDEVLSVRPDKPAQWLKPVAISDYAAIPGGADKIAESVRQSWKGQFFDVEEEANGGTITPGLRPPQIGALYATLAHWKVTLEPATIVMPTGTGKTETMLAILLRERLGKLFVVVPTDALRDQLARKFQTLGVLRAFGVISDGAQFPVVGVLRKIPGSVADIERFFEPCNVVVTTMSIAGRSPELIQRAFGNCSTHLFIDEAHHIKAPTWERVKASFEGKPVLQFTATPFRNDGKAVDGKLIFTYPLRKAQQEGYFRRITFRPIVEFLPQVADEKIATRAIEQLRADLLAGFDHLLMARTEDIRKATEIFPIYQSLAADLNPVLLHSDLPPADREAALAAIRTRQSRVIVCVNMLGEGFDLPQLKIAAIHDVHKSLAVTLQFIGRFTRSLSGVGDATAVANIAAPEVEGALRALYAEDTDWNALLQVLADGSTQREAKRMEFLSAFSGNDFAVPLQNVMPKMSTVVYKTSCTDWRLATLERFATNMGMYGSLAVNQKAKVALFIVRSDEQVEWGAIRGLSNTIWHLYLLYWDSTRQLLFINTSNKDINLDDLANAAVGDNAALIRGEAVFRSFSGFKRLMLMNLGLNHSLSRVVRFTMYVGSDIRDGLSQAQQQGKIKSNTFGRGFENGEKGTIGCSHRGRIWSYRIASDVSEWVEWCDAVGTKVLDASISFDKNILPYLLIPEEITARPARVPIMIEWSEELYKRNEDYVSLEMDGNQVPFFEVGIDLVNRLDTGPLSFRIFTERQSYEYEVIFTGGEVVYRPRQTDLRIRFGRNEPVRLSKFFQEEPPVIYFDTGGFLIYNRYCEQNLSRREPYDPDRIAVWDWTGVDIAVESQTRQKLQHSIQYRAIRRILAASWPVQYDFVIDDDSANEAADVVAIKVEGEEILVDLFHCKFSSRPEPGARVDDLYELCAQAQRSARWRHDIEKLLHHLLRRNAKRVLAGDAARFERGTPEALAAVKNRCRFLLPRLHVFIVQPGLSKKELKANQLELLATTELHLKEISLAELSVIGSE